MTTSLTSLIDANFQGVRADLINLMNSTLRSTGDATITGNITYTGNVNFGSSATATTQTTSTNNTTVATTKFVHDVIVAECASGGAIYNLINSLIDARVEDTGETATIDVPTSQE